jgi:hypothetical protein
MRAVEGSGEQARAQGVGRTTTEGEHVTQYHLELIAALEYARLMMRLGVGMH